MAAPYTRLHLTALPGKEYGSFAGKEEAVDTIGDRAKKPYLAVNLQRLTTR